MRKTLIQLSVLTSSLLCLSSTIALPPAAQDAPPDRTFVERIDVRLVQVEVVVTDKEGERVAGLGREDFRLRLDGEEVPIDLFHEIRNGEVYSLAGQGQESAATTDGSRSLLFFIDDYYTIRRYRNRLFDRLLESLDQMGPRDQGAVVRFAGEGLEDLTDWTTDKGKLRRVLAQAQGLKSGELTRLAHLSGLSAGGADLTHFYKLRQQQVQKISSAVVAAMRTFPEADGRKLLVLLSSGWPYETILPPGVSAREAAAINRYTTEEALFDVVHTANLQGYTIYPLHLGLAESPEGLVLDAATDVDTTDDDAPNEPAGGGSDRSQRDSLRLLADATGGQFQAFSIVKPEPPMELIAQDTRAYYVLGIYPQMEGDGVQHTFEVELPGRDGFQVRHREGYLDLTPEKQAAMTTEAALLWGPASNKKGPGLEVRVGEYKKAGRRAEVPLEVVLPMDWVTMLPSQNGFSASLELRVAALDERGDRSEMPTIPIDFSGPQPPPPGSHSIYETVLKLRRKAQTVVLSLYDRNSGEILTTTFDFAP
jgi:VWFA-related protein